MLIAFCTSEMTSSRESPAQPPPRDPSVLGFKQRLLKIISSMKRRRMSGRIISRRGAKVIPLAATNVNTKILQPQGHLIFHKQHWKPSLLNMQGSCIRKRCSLAPSLVAIAPLSQDSCTPLATFTYSKWKLPTKFATDYSKLISFLLSYPKSLPCKSSFHPLMRPDTVNCNLHSNN